MCDVCVYLHVSCARRTLLCNCSFALALIHQLNNVLVISTRRLFRCVGSSVYVVRMLCAIMRLTATRSTRTHKARAEICTRIRFTHTTSISLHELPRMMWWRDTINTNTHLSHVIPSLQTNFLAFHSYVCEVLCFSWCSG